MDARVPGNGVYVMTDQRWLLLFKLLNEARSEYEVNAERGSAWCGFTEAIRLSEGVLMRDFGMTEEQIEKGQTVIGNIDPNTRECLELCDVHCNPGAMKSD